MNKIYHLSTAFKVTFGTTRETGEETVNVSCLSKRDTQQTAKNYKQKDNSRKLMSLTMRGLRKKSNRKEEKLHNEYKRLGK